MLKDHILYNREELKKRKKKNSPPNSPSLNKECPLRSICLKSCIYLSSSGVAISLRPSNVLPKQTLVPQFQYRKQKKKMCKKAEDIARIHVSDYQLYNPPRDDRSLFFFVLGFVQGLLGKRLDQKTHPTSNPLSLTKVDAW